jgi:hypothetical protein
MSIAGATSRSCERRWGDMFEADTSLAANVAISAANTGICATVSDKSLLACIPAVTQGDARPSNRQS